MITTRVKFLSICPHGLGKEQTIPARRHIWMNTEKYQTQDFNKV